MHRGRYGWYKVRETCAHSTVDAVTDVLLCTPALPLLQVDCVLGGAPFCFFLNLCEALRLVIETTLFNKENNEM